MPSAVPCRRLHRPRGGGCCGWRLGTGSRGEVARVCGVTVADLDADKARFRSLLQWWAQEWRRRDNADYWVAPVRHFLAAHRDEPVIYCLTDVRFPNEAGLVRDFGGVLARGREAGNTA